MRLAPIPLTFFSNSLQRGGVEEYVLSLLRGLDRERFRLSWVCPPALAERMQPDVPAEVKIIPLWLGSPRHVSAAAALARLLRRVRPGILHSHLFRASLFASPMGRACGVPVILETPHIRESWRKGWKASYAVDRMVGRCVDRYIAVSEANARYLAEDKGIPAGKIETIRFGTDLSRFDPCRPAPPGMRRAMGFEDSDVVLFAGARLEPQKGHAVLIAAMKRVLRAAANVRLVCVGEGSLRGELEELVRAEGLEHAVRFAGFQKNVPDWLAIADIAVLSSFYEGLPLVAIESLAAGKPVVASAVDGTPEVVPDGRCGLLTRPGDADELAGAIRTLACDPELRRKFGAEGRRWVEERFSRERFIRATEEFYLRQWGRRRGRRAR